MIPGVPCLNHFFFSNIDEVMETGNGDPIRFIMEIERGKGKIHPSRMRMPNVCGGEITTL